MEKKKLELLLDLAEDNDGYVSVPQAAQIGVVQAYLSQGEKDGIFCRVGKGLYRKKGYPEDPFYEISYRYGKAVFAFESALFLHGLIDEISLSVNLPTNYLTQGIPNAKCRHVGQKEYETGQSLVVSPRGNLVMSYDLERVMIDLIRREGDFDAPTFINIYRKAKEKSPYHEKLVDYARAFHVEGELRILEKLV